MSYKKQFEEFLKEQDVFTAFCKNLLNRRNTPLSFALFLYDKNDNVFSAEHWITEAFAWYEDRELGYEFWSGINEKWQQKIHKHINYELRK